MFNFSNTLLFFSNQSKIYNLDEFISDESLHLKLSRLYNCNLFTTTQFNRCVFFLKDGRILKNIFVTNSGLVLSMNYWSKNKGLVHDAVEKHLFDITINVFEEYKFIKDDIIKIELNNAVIQRSFFEKKLNDDDLLIQIIPNSA